VGGRGGDGSELAKEKGGDKHQHRKVRTNEADARLDDAKKGTELGRIESHPLDQRREVLSRVGVLKRNGKSPEGGNRVEGVGGAEGKNLLYWERNRRGKHHPRPSVSYLMRCGAMLGQVTIKSL